MRSVRMGACLLLAAAAVAWTRPQPKAVNSPPAPNGAAVKKDARAPVAGQRLLNPESPAARLMLATPEQRQRALQRFPAARQEQIQKQLAWFDSLPKEQQDVQIRRLERFASLPTDRQLLVRMQMAAFNKLPPQRKQAVRRALIVLQSLPDAQRAARLKAPFFRARFSPDELKIIEDLSDAWLPSM